MSGAKSEVETADKAADVAAEKAKDARRAADVAHAKAMREAQDRADAVEKKKPRWQTIHETIHDRTERLIMEGGYILRSSWRHVRGIGGDPLVGSSVTFIPGSAPAMPNVSALVLGPADLLPGVDPSKAVLADVYPVTQLTTATEVILWLPDGRVRVLKSLDRSTINTTRDATAADGAPVKAAPTPAPSPPPPPPAPPPAPPSPPVAPSPAAGATGPSGS